MPTLPKTALAVLLAFPLFACAAPQQTTQGVAAPAADTAVAPAPAPAAPAATPAPAAPAPQAAPPQPAPVTMPGPTGPSAGNLLQTTLALLLVLAVLAALAWFMKRYGPRAGGASAHLRVVGALSLGGRERIMVVEVGDQWIVVGASPGRVNALATMPRQEGVAPSAALAGQMPTATGFADWLKQTIDKRNAK